MPVRGYTMDKSEYLWAAQDRRPGARAATHDRNDTYCIDVITQIGSACGALQSVALGLLDQHLRHCVMEAAASSNGDGDLKLTEATRAIERLLKL